MKSIKTYLTLILAIIALFSAVILVGAANVEEEKNAEVADSVYELIESYEEEAAAKAARLNDLLAQVVSIDTNAWSSDVMNRAHELADMARAEGCAEDHEIITTASAIWWDAYANFCYDRDIIATVVYNEAWYGCSDRHRELVAAAIVNRTRESYGVFPSTVYGVVTQRGQYHYAYAQAGSYYGQRARADYSTWLHCQTIAEKAIRGEVECPQNMVFQANFRQGNGTYETHYTSYSVTYFCISNKVGAY